MSNSLLAKFIKLLPFKNSPRNQKITKITIHHYAGVAALEDYEALAISREESCNYLIDKDARVGLFCDEGDRSWCSSSQWNDNRAVTIEVSNSKVGGDWPVSDKVYNKLIDLCVDICQRNGIPELKYTGDKNGSLTTHDMFAATECPGPYLKARMNDIAEQVNKRIKMEPVKAENPSVAREVTDDLVNSVIAGLYGNGEERKKKLEAEGYDYKAVQAKVDIRMAALKEASKPKLSIEEVAKLVIRGDYGNGAARKKKLNAEGYKYDEVQAVVDRILAEEKAKKTDASKISSTKLAVAHGFNVKYSGTYTVIPSTVNLRLVPGNMSSSAVLTTLATKTKVRNYGYYENVNGKIWLLVVANGKTGFIDLETLHKV